MMLPGARDDAEEHPSSTERTACGTTTCDAATQDCCISGSWQGTCAAKGSCTTGVLSCSGSASCSGGQICCATVATDGRPTAACAAGPCPAYQLCARPSECTGGQPWHGHDLSRQPGSLRQVRRGHLQHQSAVLPQLGHLLPGGLGILLPLSGA